MSSAVRAMLTEHRAGRRDDTMPGVHPARRDARDLFRVAVAARAAGVGHVAGMGNQVAVRVVATGGRRIPRVTGRARRTGEGMASGEARASLAVAGDTTLGGDRRAHRTRTGEQRAQERCQQSARSDNPAQGVARTVLNPALSQLSRCQR